jgi:hypothetical protein
MATPTPKPASTPQPTPPTLAPAPLPTPPATAAAPVASPRPSSPAPRPSSPPPPPTVERRPPRPRNPPQLAPVPAAPPPTTERVLPEDPAARAAALETVKDEVALCLGLADIVATKLPPKRPLSPEEKDSIAGPLAQVLYKHGGNIPCEWALVITCAFVAAGRYAEFKAGQDDPQGKLAGV